MVGVAGKVERDQNEVKTIYFLNEQKQIVRRSEYKSEKELEELMSAVSTRVPGYSRTDLLKMHVHQFHALLLGLNKKE